MTNILCIGDVHFTSTTLQYTDILHKSVVSNIIPKLVEKGYDKIMVVFLGDILHNHERIYTNAYNRALKFIWDVSQHPNVIRTYLLIGNHDFVNNSQFLSDNHGFNSLKQWSKLVVVDTVIMENNMIFCPYVPNKRFIEALNSSGYLWNNCDIIFSHVCVSGARYGAIELTEEDADVWLQEYPLLISGHIHDYQKVAKNCIYTGASYQISDGETPNKKLLFLANIGTDEFKKVRKSVDGMRIRGILRLTISEYLQSNEIDFHKYTRILLSGTKEEIHGFKITDAFRKMREKTCVCFKIQQIQKNEEKTGEIQKTFGTLFKEKLTPEELQYIKTFIGEI